jgi:hypothetical protein
MYCVVRERLSSEQYWSSSAEDGIAMEKIGHVSNSYGKVGFDEAE